MKTIMALIGSAPNSETERIQDSNVFKNNFILFYENIVIKYKRYESYRWRTNAVTHRGRWRVGPVRGGGKLS